MWATRVVSGPPHVPRWPHQPVGSIQSVPKRLSTRREMVPGQKSGVYWPHGALGGRPAPGNQGRNFGLGGLIPGPGELNSKFRFGGAVGKG